LLIDTKIDLSITELIKRREKNLKNIFISVVIPTFNSEDFIEKTINSIYLQTFKNYEVIVYDDGSTDGTHEVCKKFEKYDNFRFVNGEHTGNIAKNRNTAVFLTKGDFIAFLDSDDIWESNKLELQLIYLDKYNIVCSNAVIIDEKDNIIAEKYFTGLENVNELLLFDLVKVNYLITSTVLMEKKTFYESGLFDENLANLAEDYALWLKASENNKIKYIDNNLIKYRKHTGNISFRNKSRRYNMLKNTINLQSEYLESNNKKVRHNAKIGVSLIYQELAYFYLYYNKYIKSFLYIFRTVLLYPEKITFKFFGIINYFIKMFIMKITGRMKY